MVSTQSTTRYHSVIFFFFFFFEFTQWFLRVDKGSGLLVPPCYCRQEVQKKRQKIVKEFLLGLTAVTA
jgi:hypothetical protein